MYDHRASAQLDGWSKETRLGLMARIRARILDVRPCLLERSDQSIVFNDNVDSGTTSAATNMTITTSTSSTNDVNKHERLYKLKQDYHILKQQLTTLEEEVEAIKSRINGNNKTTSGYPSSFVLQNCIVNGNLRAGL
ncbi:PREDICTED: uncharacterized protein LOC105460737, partial [Wasmannia auropunctata]|uniref:uncharacterized protein LOC105460737 n=1 Tax=Wasmannia auropunctata TaxID=64793 RepID=UPI0005F0BB3D